MLGNLDKVTEMTDGQVGYLHIPDMGEDGIAECIKWFYPQIRKEGLVVDVRGNGGGNVSQWIIERLDSKLLGTRFGRTYDMALTYPGDRLPRPPGLSAHRRPRPPTGTSSPTTSARRASVR